MDIPLGFVGETLPERESYKLKKGLRYLTVL